MADITFKQYYLDKCIYWLFSTVAVIIVVISLIFNFSFENRFFLCSALLGAGTYFNLYLNRFEPRLIELDNENFEITYFNQIIFAGKDRYYSKNVINVLKKDDALILSYNTNIVAKIRKTALSPEDWETLKNYFG